MKFGYSIILTVFLSFSFVHVAHAQEIIAGPCSEYSSVFGPVEAVPKNFHGQEIQKVIDYLRSIGKNESADNIQLYLDNCKIIIKPLERGSLGENDEKGGPVYLDPVLFRPQRMGGFNSSKTIDITDMMQMATTLIHEKYHSEHHDAYIRDWSNKAHKWRLGYNGVEMEAWAVELDFRDGAIFDLLNKAKDPSLGRQEKKKLLEIIEELVKNKIKAIDDYNEEKYGPALNTSYLQRLLNDIEKKRKELEDNSTGTLEVGSLIESHDKFEEEVIGEYEGYIRNIDQTIESDSQLFATEMFGIVAAAKNRPVDEPLKLYLVIDSEIPSDGGYKEYLLNYRPQKKIKISGGVKPDYSDYILNVSRSVFMQIYSDKDPAGKARELFDQGRFSVVETEPEQDVIGKELDALLSGYINTGKIPASVRSLVDNEKINFVIDIGDGKKAIRGVFFRNDGSESVKGGFSDPTIEFRTTTNIFKNIKNDPDKQAAFMKGLNDGSIEYRALGTGSRIKLFAVKLISRFAGLTGKGTFEVGPGEKRTVVYAGKEAILQANPDGLKIVVIPGNKDLPVVDKFGSTLGYINPRVQAQITKRPGVYSSNAGTYRYGISTYEDHWKNIDYEPLVPTFATGYSSKELMISAYNGRTYAGIGGVK